MDRPPAVATKPPRNPRAATMMAIGLFFFVAGLGVFWVVFQLHTGMLKETSFSSSDYADYGKTYTRDDVPTLARQAAVCVGGGSILLFFGVRSMLRTSRRDAFERSRQSPRSR